MIEMGQALMTSLVNNNDQGITPHSREEFISLLEETLHQELEEMDTSDSELDDNDSDNGGRGDELMEQVAESQQMVDLATVLQYFLGRLSRPDIAISNSRLYHLNKHSTRITSPCMHQ